MREPLVLRLEQLSYYQHLSLSGGKERPIFTYRIIDIRGSRFHVLSRIQDAGLDFTGRTNFIAHHLALAPEEFRQFPTPPIILRDWPEWAKSWTREPTLLENEDWSALISLATKSSVPAQTWQRVTGNSVNGYGLLEARAGATFRVDGQTNETVLGLFAESIELLDVRDARRDFHAAALQYTFTTSMQEQDNPADFRWRCIHSDNPAANRFATPDCRALSAVRATKWTGEEATFASTGRQAPKFVLEPQDVQITEGDAARFQAKAEGIPNPTYQWFLVDRTDNRQTLTGETNPELVLPNPTRGKSRYVVRVTNSRGEAISRTVTLSVEHKPLVARASLGNQARPLVSTHQRSASEIDSQRKRLEDQARSQQRQSRKRVLTVVAIIVATVAISCVILDLTGRWSVIIGLVVKPIAPPQVASAKKESSAAQTSSLLSRTPATSTDNHSTNTVQNATTNLEPTRDQKVMLDSFLSNETNLPAGWRRMAIGTTNVHAKYLDSTNLHGQFELSARAEGFRTNGDSLLFVGKTNAGSSFSAVLLKIDSGTPLNHCGIMVRQAEQQDSPFLFIGASSDRIIVDLRPAATNNRAKLFFEAIEIPKNMKGKPIFFKLDDQNDHFTPSYSFDGIHWAFDKFPGYEIHFKEQVWVGFAASSGTLSNEVTARFFEK
jgi:hypothetical protein